MINLRNQGEFPIVLQIKGTLTTTSTNAQSYAISQPIPFNATLGAIWAVEATPGASAAGTAGDCIDLLYCADSTTSTASAQTLITSGAMFNFASSTVPAGGYYGLIPLTSTATATLGGYNTGNFTTTVGNPPAFARGGYLKIVVKTVASGFAGGDLTVVCNLNRARQGSNIDPVQIGTYDPDNDIF